MRAIGGNLHAVMDSTSRGSKRRRKIWAVNQDRRLRRRHQQAYCSPTEPATPEDQQAHRSAVAVPQVHVSPLEQYVEHRIYRWALGVCLREPLMRDRPFSQRLSSGTIDAPALPTSDDAAEWLTVWAECQNAIEDETARVIAEDDAEDQKADEHPMIALRAAIAEHARIKHVRRIYRLTRVEVDGSDVTPGELFQLIQEIKGDLASYHNAMERSGY